MAQYVGSGRRFKPVSARKDLPQYKSRVNQASENQVKHYKQTANVSSPNKFFNFFSFVGETVYDNVTDLFRTFYKTLFKSQERRFRAFRKKFVIYISSSFKKFGRTVLYPAKKISGMFRLISSIMSQTRQYPFGRRLGMVCSGIFTGLRKNSRFFTTILNYTLPIMAVVVLVNIVQFINTKDFAVVPSYNGVKVGYVRDEATVQDANQIVQGRMVYLNNDESIEFKPTYSIEIVGNEEMLNKYQLADRMLKTANSDVIEAEGLYIDNTFYGAVEDAGTLKELLEEKLDQARTDDPTEVVSFADNVQVVTGVYLTNNIVDMQVIADTVNSTTEEEQIYTTVKGDTPSIIAKKNQIDVEQLKALNPNITMSKDSVKLKAGQKMKITEATPFLPIKIERNITYTVDVDFEIETEQSEKYSMGTVKVLSKGVKGRSEVTAKVTYVNGQKTDQKVLSTTVLKEPVAQKQLQGTKSSGSGDWWGVTASTGSGKIGTSFIWPLSNYSVSSSYGKRGWSSHGGIDITVRGGSYGAPIKAVAPGTVIYTGWASTWGKLIRVDHGNGLETYYAHCSDINVQVGDKVGQGTVIGKVGSTGRSTGPHLHLEVRVNGTRQNPMSYLP